MQLNELLKKVKIVNVNGDTDILIAGITSDSRKVEKDYLFVAIKGFNFDGHKFINDAINRGAAAVIVEEKESISGEVFLQSCLTKIGVADIRKALAQISHSFYDEPSNKLKIIGITGTNGKTTTAYFIKSVLETAGFKTGLVGTIVNMIGGRESPSLLTTPEANDLNSLLHQMYNEGCEYAVMEVSSHSLVLNRVYGLQFSAAVFTNITSDHLDFHESFEKYFNAKKMLFNSLPETSIGIYNLDDKSSKNFTSDTKAKLFSYGKNTNADFRMSDITYDIEGTRFKLKNNEHNYFLSTGLIGEFNAYNASAAFAVTTSLGINPKTVVEGIKRTKQVPGRFEVVGSGDKKAIVDYSHTADSLEKALLALNELVKNQRPIYTVFGCGGNRDKTKRPIMGKIASELSANVIVTSDNPRFEEPDSIIKEIVVGIEKQNFIIEPDREKAIRKAIEDSEANAVILIAGKGHEPYQEIKGVRKHFSDKEIAEKYLIR